jgi:hypothetical protein
MALPLNDHRVLHSLRPRLVEGPGGDAAWPGRCVQMEEVMELCAQGVPLGLDLPDALLEDSGVVPEGPKGGSVDCGALDAGQQRIPLQHQRRVLRPQPRRRPVAVAVVVRGVLVRLGPHADIVHVQRAAIGPFDVVGAVLVLLQAAAEGGDLRAATVLRTCAFSSRSRTSCRTVCSHSWYNCSYSPPPGARAAAAAAAALDDAGVTGRA